MQSERDYQASLIRRIKKRFPGCKVTHNQTHTNGCPPGYPDLTIEIGDRKFEALLEVKKNAKAPKQPNQQYYIDLYADEKFTSFIYPENEEEVLNALQLAFASQGHSRYAQR